MGWFGRGFWGRSTGKRALAAAAGPGWLRLPAGLPTPAAVLSAPAPVALHAAGIPLTTVDSLVEGLGDRVLAVLDSEPEAACRELR